MPDIEMVRKLCDILEINRAEILGASIEDVKKNRKWLKVSIVISIICILIALFFFLDGFDYIDRHTQSGIAYVSVFSDGKLLSTDEYEITSELNFEDYEAGFKSDIDYGEIKGTIHLDEGYDIEFGFVNTNNWHNIHIRLDIEKEDEQLFVRQTISYETDNSEYQVMVNENTTNNNEVSVFRDGI